MPGDLLPKLRQVFERPRPNGRAVQTQGRYKREFLRQIDIFRDLTQQDLASLAEMTRMTTVKKGRIIYRQEDTVEGLFLLKRGRVRLSRLGCGGKKLDLAILEPGTFFGEMPLLGERLRNTSAEAVEDCVLCVMSRADIERLVLAKPMVALRMLDVVGRRLAESETRLEEMAYRDAPSRLASLLLRLGENNADVVEGITHQELGDLIGAYRETITKILDEFQSAGHVELGRRHIRILDRPGLGARLENV